MVNIVFKFFVAIYCLLIFQGLVAEPLLDGADFDYGEYLSGQCLTCHQNSSDEGIPAINGAEALYIAKISPHRFVHELNDEELKRLYDASLWVIKASYDARGATIRDYVMPDGTKGDFKFKFKVYSQRKDPLGHSVIKEATADGRTTHWVAEVQV